MHTDGMRTEGEMDNKKTSLPGRRSRQPEGGLT